MKKLGVGIQEFSEFKKNNLIYVDKTETIHQMVENGKYFFLSRPRRFGKSLLVNTLKELFVGHQELFEESWIHDQWNWDDQYTVLKLSFSEMGYQTIGLEKALEVYISQMAQEHGVTLESSVYNMAFIELIKKLGVQKPVVILIDEYDKPIIDYLEKDKIEQAHENRGILRNLYAGIKDADRFIRFFFMTGISKFSQVSIFSALNHLSDISVSPEYSNIVGYSEAEIRHYYDFELNRLADAFQSSVDTMIQHMALWYNGYSWDGTTSFYNPFSVLNLFHLKTFKDYWFTTGTPYFLTNLLKSKDIKLHANINQSVGESIFTAYDLEDLNLTAIMFQTGYLTIKSMDRFEGRYVLDFPNREVRQSFLNFAAKHYAQSPPQEMETVVDGLLRALKTHDLKLFESTLKALFSSITAKQLDKVKNYEGFYHSIVFIVLKILGVHIQCEIQSSFGATDVVIQTEDTIYCFEFKMTSAQDALDQIKQKQYFAPYLTDSRQIILAGFAFDKAQRNLVEVIEEVLQS